MRPKNLKEALFPFFVSSAIFGHGIFRNKAGLQRPVTSGIYAVIVTSLYFTALYHSLAFTFEQSWYDDQVKIILLIVYVCEGIFVFGILLSWCNAKRFVRITDDLTKIDDTLRELGVTFNYAKTRNEGYALILICIIMMFALNWVDVLWLFDVNPVARTFLIMSSFHYPFHAIIVGIANFSAAIRHVHLELGAISKDLCESYGIQLVLSTAAHFVMFTGFLYLLYIIAMTPAESRQDSRIVALGIWVTFYFLNFLLNNEICETACAEARRTGEIIHAICKQTDDLELTNEINQFSLQLIHEPLEFVPAGLIALGHRFVLRFVETVTTYLVILVQITPSKSGSVVSF